MTHGSMAFGGIGETFKRLGIWGYVLVAAFIITIGYLLIFHLEHLAAYSTIIYVVIFLLLHLFMHRGHGRHGGGGQPSGAQNEHAGHGTGSETKAESADESKNEKTSS